MEKNDYPGDTLPDNGELEAAVGESDRSSCTASSFAAMLANLNQISESYLHRYAEDNFSLEVNFGDGGSCQLSDVSSVSCQNVTQDDLDSLDCDSGTAAQNSLDSNSERSDSPVDFDNDKDEEGVEFSNLEAELQMKVAEQEPTGLIAPAVQEDAGELSPYSDSFDTGTMKRRFREADDREKDFSKSEIISNNDCVRSEDVGWLLNHEGQKLSNHSARNCVNSMLPNVINVDQEGNGGNDEGLYQYTPPIGLTTNGLSGSYLYSRSNVWSPGENCYVTLEFNKVLSERAIPLMKKSPGVARRVGDVFPLDGKDAHGCNDEEKRKQTDDLAVLDDVAFTNSAMENISPKAEAKYLETAETSLPCTINQPGGSLKSKNFSVEGGLIYEKNACNGLSALETLNYARSLEGTGERKVDYANDDLLAELVHPAENHASTATLTTARSTKVSEDMLTEISLNGSDLQQGDCKTFSLSPEATDCDSADIASVLSEDVNGMPFVEDGLSSSQCSDADDTPKHARRVVTGDSQCSEASVKDLQKPSDDHFGSLTAKRDHPKADDSRGSKTAKDQHTGLVSHERKKPSAVMSASSVIDEEEDTNEVATCEKTEVSDSLSKAANCDLEEKQENDKSTSLTDFLESPSLPKLPSDDDIEETSPKKGLVLVKLV